MGCNKRVAPWLWVFVALVACPALAAPEGSGGLEFLAGWRVTPNDYFAANAAKVGTPLTHASTGGPAAVASFSYVALPWLAVAIDGMIGGERLFLRGLPPLTSITYGGMIGPRFMPDLGNGFALSAGISTGAILVNVSGLNLSQANEQLDQAYMGELGLMYQLTPTVALDVEYRYLLARGFVPGYNGINGGGSWFGVGVTFWVEPQSAPHATF